MYSAIDPTVHAALVVVFAWLVKLAFNAIGVDVGDDVYTSLAGVIVTYILSLLGLNLWIRATAKARGMLPDNPEYKPPFVA
jgi:hypothetical protein